MDQNNPARFLDTAYNALKANPGATNQILQAAAQGQPVGLKGLAAAAAQQNQQEAQKAMAALQQQGPQPNIVQKLATQGIMSQMDTGLPIAPQMGAPEEMPQQMMAGGGLVAFAGGGNVLPPDVIDAIQSHFAEGGDVRGYAEGDEIAEALRRSFGFGPKAEATAEEMARLERIIAGQRIPMGMEESLRVPFQGPSEASAAAEAEALRNKIAGQRITQGMSESVAPKPFGLTGPHASSVQDEMARLDELLRKRRAAEPMLEGLQKAAKYTPEATTSTVEPTSSMTAKLTESAKPRLVGMNPADAAAEMERLTPQGSKWASGAADEAFNFGKLSELAGKLPESVKATGRFLGKAAPYSLALDPRVRALVKANVGGAKMLSERLDESEDSDLKKWLLAHGAPDLTPSSGGEDVLQGLAALRENYAYGGEVQGYAEGDLIKSLTGQSESPGIGLLKRAADLFTPDVNEAISRDEFDARRAGMEQKEKDTATLDRLLENYPRSQTKAPATPTWQQHPDPHTGTPATPKTLVHPEGAKLDKTFEQSKVDTGTKTTDKEVDTGLGAIAPGMDMEKMRDLIMGLGGRKEMSPEMLQQLGDLKDSARTSTILQSVLGALGGGLTDPYGGRFALGRAALGALGGYQKGIGSEEEIGRKAFDVLRGYADAPAEEKAKATDELFGIQAKAAERQSAERIADLKGMDAMERLLYSEYGKNYRYGQGKPVDEAKLAQIQNLALDNAQKKIDAINKQRENAIPAKPPLSAAEEQAIMREAFTSQQQFIQSGGTNLGLGGGQLGSTRPIIQ